MKSVQNKTGKNRKQNSKPRTEDPQTQDIKPKTENREQETSLPLRPAFRRKRGEFADLELRRSSREEIEDFSEGESEARSLILLNFL